MCIIHSHKEWCREKMMVLKSKQAKIFATEKMNWESALPLTLMSVRMQTKCNTHLMPHEMLTRCPMLCACLRSLYKGLSSLKKSYISM